MRLIQLARSLERRAAGRMQRRLLRQGCSPARRPPRLTMAWPPWGRSGAQAALRSSRVTRTFTQPTSGGCRRSSAPLAASCTPGAPATTRCAAGRPPPWGATAAASGDGEQARPRYSCRCTPDPPSPTAAAEHKLPAITGDDCNFLRAFSRLSRLSRDAHPTAAH